MSCCTGCDSWLSSYVICLTWHRLHYNIIPWFWCKNFIKNLLVAFHHPPNSIVAQHKMGPGWIKGWSQAGGWRRGEGLGKRWKGQCWSIFDANLEDLIISKPIGGFTLWLFNEVMENHSFFVSFCFMAFRKSTSTIAAGSSFHRRSESWGQLSPGSLSSLGKWWLTQQDAMPMKQLMRKWMSKPAEKIKHRVASVICVWSKRTPPFSHHTGWWMTLPDLILPGGFLTSLGFHILDRLHVPMMLRWWFQRRHMFEDPEWPMMFGYWNAVWNGLPNQSRQMLT